MFLAVLLLLSTRAPLVQSLDVQIPMAPTPVTIAGKPHLVYELHVTNFRNVDLALTELEIVDLVRWRDAELAKRMAFIGGGSRLTPGSRAVIFVWLAVDAIPAKLQHRITFTAGEEQGVVEVAPVAIRSEAPVVLSPPLRGGPWVALYDPLMPRGHRTSIYTIGGRARIPARFAIDWMRMDDQATLAKGDSSKITSWHGYGADVLAVADAVVADARDDIDEHESISGAHGPMQLENASGNYVALDLGDGRYAFYEHLKRGSVRVRAGDRVKRGQVIGLLGNSGSSSSGPHLHFHVSDTNATLEAEGVPWVLHSFDVIGAYDSIRDPGSGKCWNPPNRGGKRSNELPAANAVIVFE